MRKNISLSKQIEVRAKDLIDARGFDGLSDLIATLIREEYERRNPAEYILKESPSTPIGQGGPDAVSSGHEDTSHTAAELETAKPVGPSEAAKLVHRAAAAPRESNPPIHYRKGRKSRTQ